MNWLANRQHEKAQSDRISVALMQCSAMAGIEDESTVFHAKRCAVMHASQLYRWL